MDTPGVRVRGFVLLISVNFCIYWGVSGQFADTGSAWPSGCTIQLSLHSGMHAPLIYHSINTSTDLPRKSTLSSHAETHFITRMIILSTRPASSNMCSSTSAYQKVLRGGSQTSLVIVIAKNPTLLLPSSRI